MTTFGSHFSMKLAISCSMEKKALFLEGDNIISTKEEQEANEFSARVLIPRQYQQRYQNLPGSSLEVIKFARQVGVSPGIVVGQLQHIGRLQRTELNLSKGDSVGVTNF